MQVIELNFLTTICFSYMNRKVHNKLMLLIKTLKVFLSTTVVICYLIILLHCSEHHVRTFNFVLYNLLYLKYLNECKWIVIMMVERSALCMLYVSESAQSVLFCHCFDALLLYCCNYPNLDDTGVSSNHVMKSTRTCIICIQFSDIK